MIVHIAIALLRIKEGRYVPMERESLEKMRGTREFSVAHLIASDVEQSEGVKLPEEEVAYIAIHLSGRQTLSDSQVGSSSSGSDSSVISSEVWDVVSRMLDAVWQTYHFDFRNDLELRMNLARHIAPLVVRLKYHMNLTNPLLADIKTRFPLAFTIALDASAVLANTYGSKPSEDEVGYIALAFALALERQKEPGAKKNLLLVCASGRGTAKLLEYRCLQEFGDYIHTVTTCDYTQVRNVDFSQIDYVFTTVPLDVEVPVPVQEITLFLDESEVADVRNALSAESRRANVGRFFSRELYFPNLELDSEEAILDFLCARLSQVGGYDSCLRDLVQAREDLMSTAYGNGVAVPHPLEALEGNTHACLAILDKPVKWGPEGSEVNLVLLVAYGTADVSHMGDFHQAVVNLLFEPATLELVKRGPDFDAFVSLLEQSRAVS